MWKNASWILHHDNAPAHNTLSVKRYLAKNNIQVMEHPLYSPWKIRMERCRDRGGDYIDGDNILIV